MSGEIKMEVKQEYDALKNLVDVLSEFCVCVEHCRPDLAFASKVDDLVAYLLAGEGRLAYNMFSEPQTMPSALTNLLNHLYVVLADSIYYCKNDLELIDGIACELEEFIEDAVWRYEKFSPLKVGRLKELAAFFSDEVAKIRRAYIWEKEKLKKFDEFTEISDEVYFLIKNIIDIKKRSRSPCRFAVRVLEYLLRYLRRKAGEDW